MGQVLCRRAGELWGRRGRGARPDREAFAEDIYARLGGLEGIGLVGEGKEQVQRCEGKKPLPSFQILHHQGTRTSEKVGGLRGLGAAVGASSRSLGLIPPPSAGSRQGSDASYM